MVEITVTVAGRDYTVPCRDGEELHFKRLEALLLQHAPTAQRASGGMSHDRTLLYLALILADQIDEAGRNPTGGGISAALLDNIADRLEAVAAILEEDSTPA